MLRRVEQGERLTVTRNGRPVADLVPRARHEGRDHRTLGELQEVFRAIAPVDRSPWGAERAEADGLLGTDAIEE